MHEACLVQVLQEPYAGNPVFNNLIFFHPFSGCSGRLPTRGLLKKKVPKMFRV
jgi:hypothetical protein